MIPFVFSPFKLGPKTCFGCPLVYGYVNFLPGMNNVESIVN